MRAWAMVLCAALASTARAGTPATPAAYRGPSLVTKDGRTRLEVDGHPFFVRGGELANSSATNLAVAKAALRKLTGLGLNTVLVPVSWELVEPQEGSATLRWSATSSERRAGPGCTSCCSGSGAGRTGCRATRPTGSSAIRNAFRAPRRPPAPASSRSRLSRTPAATPTPGPSRRCCATCAAWMRVSRPSSWFRSRTRSGPSARPPIAARPRRRRCKPRFRPTSCARTPRAP